MQESSTLEIVDVTFSGSGAPWGVSYGQLSLGGVTGAFTGGDGATSSNVSLTTKDVARIFSPCSSLRGPRTVNVGLGTLTLQ